MTLNKSYNRGGRYRQVSLYSLSDILPDTYMATWWGWESPDIDGLVQERRNSSALPMELRLSCLTHRYEAELMWSGMLICRSLGINLWRSESIWEFNIFASSVIWRHSDCIQVVKTLPPGNQGSIYFMQPISWLLIKWRHKVIWYRRPLYWRNLTEIFWPKHWLDSIIYVVRQAHEKKITDVFLYLQTKQWIWCRWLSAWLL